MLKSSARPKWRLPPSLATGLLLGLSLSFNAGAGLHKLFFQGRLTRTRKLNPGTYTLTITATNAPAGQRATKGPLRSFTIVPG